MPRHTPAEAPVISFGDPSALMPLQAVLALTYFHAQHPELAIDTTHPDAVDRTVRNAAMMLWLEGGDTSPSARFRAYADAHPSESISITDEDEIEKLCATLVADPNPTVH